MAIHFAPAKKKKKKKKEKERKRKENSAMYMYLDRFLISKLFILFLFFFYLYQFIIEIMSGEWLDDGSATITGSGPVVTCNATPHGDSVFHALWKGDGPVSSGTHYWEVEDKGGLLNPFNTKAI